MSPPELFLWKQLIFAHQGRLCLGIYTQQSKHNTSKNYAFKSQTKKSYGE